MAESFSTDFGVGGQCFGTAVQKLFEGGVKKRPAKNPCIQGEGVVG